MKNNNVEIRNIEPDYIHSSNTLFSFMKKADYLEEALLKRSVSPRYCEENVEYLKLMNGTEKIDKVCVLQKCFCDIPLHRVTNHFPLEVTSDKSLLDNEILQKLNEGSTHTDFYGEYGIAFSKSWAQQHNLQPVQYVNPKSIFAIQFKNSFEYVLDQEDIDDLVVSDIIMRLAYFKPLYGTMTRIIDEKRINYLKNFYDECEYSGLRVPTVRLIGNRNSG